MGAVNPTTFSILTYRAFEPTEISGLKAWYDASTINQADGTNVSAWLDSSGNEAHMYQSTTSAQPTLQTNELNGRAVVRFDGTDDFMNLTAPFDVVPTNTSSVNACKFSPNGEYLVHLNSSTSPYIFIYKKNGNVYNKLANPSPLPPSTTYGCSWSPDSNYLVVNHAVTPFVSIYKRTDDTFTKLSNPVTIPNASSSGSGWSNDGVYLGVSGGFSSPSNRFYVYKRSFDTFTKIADPATLPTTGDARAVEFSTNDSFVALASQNTPYIYFYSFNKTTDTLTKLTDPTILPTNEVFSVDWLDDQTCAVGYGSSTIQIYQYNGTKFEQLTTLNTGMAISYALKYSRDKNYLAVAGQLSPFMKVYSISGTTYTALSNPASLPLAQSRGVTWGLNDTSLVISHLAPTPLIQAYTFDGTTLTNLTKLNMFRNVGGGTVFAVVKYTLSAINNPSFIATTGTSSSAHRVSLNKSSTDKFRVNSRRLDADAEASLISSQLVSTSYYIQTGLIDYNNSNGYQYVNNTIDPQNNNFLTDGLSSNTNSQNIRIGYDNSSFLNGDIAEIIVFNRTLTTQELKNVHYYLAQKYNISVPL